MSRATPLIEALRSAFAKNPKIHAWQIRNVRQSGHQTYLVKTQLESERRTQDETHDVAVFVRNGERLGRADLSFGSGEDAQLEARLDEAVFMAGLGGDAPWSLPGTQALPAIEAYDAALDTERARATSQAIVERWRSTVANTKGVAPSSMEVFCASQTSTLENSMGLTAESRETRVSLLTVLLSSQGTRAAERESWEERRRAGDLDVEAIVGQTAEEALDLTRAELPPSGSYPVVIDAHEIEALFSPIRSNASGQSLYQKSSRFEIGKPLPIEGQGGEPLTVISNATVPFGLASYAFDTDGVAGRRVELVKDGVFVTPWATKQYADYLGLEPTGSFANLELPLGDTALADLCQADGPVLFVRAFSWLTPDQARGTFSSEVRFGYLFDKGKRTPVKGGSVSGSLFAALGAARYASDRVFLESYLGPAGIRLEGVTIAGA